MPLFAPCVALKLFRQNWPGGLLPTTGLSHFEVCSLKLDFSPSRACYMAHMRAMNAFSCSRLTLGPLETREWRAQTPVSGERRAGEAHLTTAALRPGLASCSVGRLIACADHAERDRESSPATSVVPRWLIAGGRAAGADWPPTVLSMRSCTNATRPTTDCSSS